MLLNDLPPCARYGQSMSDQGTPEEYECKPCRFMLAPLSHMRGENKGKLLFSIINAEYEIEDLPHIEELVEWVRKHIIQ